ncbi:MAG: DNA polymerase/3'-5' exonuclease PolX [Candidatus Pacebacteria bacterium]|nr:DNA polymerase/3'-5' exonuclease PolX [Candidatus Paceibacterota bacterium]
MNANKELAKIFYEIADFLRMGKIDFRPKAYENAGDSLSILEKDVSLIYKQQGLKGLDEIPGVGESIAKKIEEYLKTGKMKYYQRLKRKIPIDLYEIVKVEGVGLVKAKILYVKLGIKNLQDLEKSAKNNEIAPLFGFGEKTETNILQAIEFLKTSKGKFLLAEILPIAQEIESKLKNQKQVKKISLCGSLRRKKELIKDIDILASAENPKKVMDFFTTLPGVIKVWRKGTTFSSIRNKQGIDIDLRIVPAKSFGSALQYFTGSVEHNIVTRKIAMKKGLKLNEYGLFKNSKAIAGKNEKEIYKKLGMDLPPPEIRENKGEIETILPKLIELKNIKGDLHCHSKWSDGDNSIKEMAQTAIALGYEYLGISDHTKSLKILHRTVSEKQLIEQRKVIDVLNKKFNSKNLKFKLLQSAETNILNNGSIDIKDNSLKKLDYAIAGIHSGFKMSKQQMTQRIINAMKNPYIKVIVHPTGRVLKTRQAYEIDFGKILRAAKEFGIILEINACPARLDLSDKNIRIAKQVGVKMIINSDAHSKDQLKNMEFGVYQARRGWAEKKDILNTKSLDKILKFLK